MPKVRDTILLAYAFNLIDATESLLLYDVNSPKNPDIPYSILVLGMNKTTKKTKTKSFLLLASPLDKSHFRVKFTHVLS